MRVGPRGPSDGPPRAFSPLQPGSERTPFEASKPALGRVKPCALRRLRRSLTGQGLTRLAGPLWPGRAQPRPEGETNEPLSKRPTSQPQAAALPAQLGPADRYELRDSEDP